MLNWFKKLFSSPPPSQATASLDGKQYRVVNSFSDLVSALKEEKRALYAFRSLGYTSTLRSLLSHMESKFGSGSPEASAVIPAPVICSKCSVLFPDSWRIQVTMSGSDGASCPSCGSESALLQFVIFNPEDITEEDIQSLQLYRRHLAKEWWENSGDESTGCWNSMACGEIGKGEGYLVGNNLIKCEKCHTRMMEGALEELRKNPDYFGSGMIEKARKFKKDSEAGS